MYRWTYAERWVGRQGKAGTVEERVESRCGLTKAMAMAMEE
jgi:hypothetical protein